MNTPEPRPIPSILTARMLELTERSKTLRAENARIAATIQDLRTQFGPRSPTPAPAAAPDERKAASEPPSARRGQD
jgi:hypothetical protein